jgi:flavin-dependent dehydrogenase
MSSQVAHWAGAPTDHRGTASSALNYGYWPGIATQGYEWYFRSGTGAGAIPTNHDQTCVYVASPRGRYRPDRMQSPTTRFRRLLTATAPELAQRLANTAPTGPLRRFAGRPGHLRRAAGPGWALVGDAGYFKDPITPHGITDALRDAELLAQAIIDALSDSDESAPLAGYQAARDRLSLPLFTATDAIASYAWDSAQLNALLKQCSAAMAAEVAAILTGRADPRQASLSHQQAPAGRRW